jgi:hypothetical protein
MIHNLKCWTKITQQEQSINHCLRNLIKKNIQLSPWILDIYKNNKNKITYKKKNFNLYRVKVKDLGFKKPTKLKFIYKSLKKKKFKLVPPDVALRARLVYSNQKKGEWLRFATPLKSMIDTDGIPHLPKLGCALGKYFVETYWAYPDAVFHPHNEFVVTK